MKRCVFFDRDGIINVSPGDGYVTHPGDFFLSPEFPDILRYVYSKGFVAIVITNQRGIARGIMTESDLEDVHARMHELLQAEGLEVLDVFYCPHGEDECDCRKPLPGMLLEAAEKHGINLSESWMVGDSPRDIEAGRDAGCGTIFVGSEKYDTGADHSVKTLAGLRERIAGWV